MSRWADLEQRLEAWGEWGRRRHRRQHQAGSAEGDWRSDPNRGERAPNTQRPLDAKDCQRIEFAWTGLTVLREKSFLWMRYRQQWAPRRILLIVADMPGPMLYPHDWDAVYEAAHVAIEQALGEPRRHAPTIGLDIFPAMA